jgi:hypothetical protein
LLTGGSFSRTPQISKYFKLLIFLPPQSRCQITQVVETERHLFQGKRIDTLSLTAHIKLNAIVHTKFHRFPTLLSSPMLSHSLFAALHPLLLRDG